MLGYLPLATTLVALVFAGALGARWRAKRSAHLAWWTLGVLCYGAGTTLESAITLCGSSVALVKAWYVAGALLGAWPLAQGTCFLLFSRATARRLLWLVLPLVVLGALGVALSPVDAARLLPDRPSPQILLWTPVRFVAPVVNGYAALVLVGGAALSAWRFARRRDALARAVGNGLIALGALLPGIGGALARSGGVEALYATELAGLLLIWAGYAACTRAPGPPQVTDSARA